MQPDTNRQGHASRAGRARGAGPCCPSGLRAAACLPSPQRASAGPRPEPRGTGQVYLKEKPYEEYNGAESYVFGAGRALRCAAPPPPPLAAAAAAVHEAALQRRTRSPCFEQSMAAARPRETVLRHPGLQCEWKALGAHRGCGATDRHLLRPV